MVLVLAPAGVRVLTLARVIREERVRFISIFPLILPPFFLGGENAFLGSYVSELAENRDW